MRHLEFVHQFLTVADLKQWEQAVKQTSKQTPLRLLQDFTSPDGMLNVQVL